MKTIAGCATRVLVNVTAPEGVETELTGYVRVEGESRSAEVQADGGVVFPPLPAGEFLYEIRVNGKAIAWGHLLARMSAFPPTGGEMVDWELDADLTVEDAAVITLEMLPGAQGLMGESAYDAAVEGGFEGTEEEFAAMLAALPQDAANAAESAADAAASQAAAAASQAAAAASQAAAAASESAAAASSTAAGNSATAASTKATEAANSATTAGTKATEAANSASAAAGSASTASTKATEAAGSATTASTKATAAANSATAAANSATAASTKATEAANSASAAAGSASTASTKAIEAAGSATTASTKATAAANSATAAAQSAADAAEQLGDAALQSAEVNTFSGTNTFNGSVALNGTAVLAGTLTTPGTSIPANEVGGYTALAVATALKVGFTATEWLDLLPGVQGDLPAGMPFPAALDVANFGLPSDHWGNTWKGLVFSAKTTKIPDAWTFDNLVSFCSNSSDNHPTGLFHGCSKLTSLPEGMTLSKLVNGGKAYQFSAVPQRFGMFNGCTGLTSLPEGMTLPGLVYGDGMFQSCSGLTSLPEGMTLSALTTGIHMFNGCTGLTSLPEGMTLSALTNGIFMFQSCTLDAASVQRLLQSLPDRTAAGLGVAEINVGKVDRWNQDQAALAEIKDILQITDNPANYNVYPIAKGWKVKTNQW